METLCTNSTSIEKLVLEGSAPKGTGPLLSVVDSSVFELTETQEGFVMKLVGIGLGSALVVLIVAVAVVVSKDVAELNKSARDPIYIPPGV